MFKASAASALVLSFLLGSGMAHAAPALEANSYFATPTDIKKFLVENSSYDVENTFSTFDADALVVKPAPGATWRLQLEGTYRRLGDDGARYSEPVAVLMDYSYVENRVLGGTGHMAGISFCKGIAYLDRSKPDCYGMPTVSREEQERASVLARYFVSRRAPRLLEEAHTDALIDFRKGRKADAANAAAALMQAAPWQVVPVTAANVESYNDLGFFLEEGGKYKEAVPVLEEVTRAVPDRAPAFLNLGDAYAGLSDNEHAKAAYQRYQKLMEQAGNGAKVPKRIQKYLDK